MKIRSRFCRGGTALFLLWFAVLMGPYLGAQAPADSSKATKAPEDLTPAELLRSYHQLREQLHATQLAVLNSRVESEAAARAQAAVLTEKLETIRQAIETERERQRNDTQRLVAEREKQEAESQRTQRTFLWIACVFGGFGLLAMLATPFFQWRAITRVTQGATGRSEATSLAPVLAPAPHPATSAALSEQAVALSNQRLMTVIDRVEQRILELEHTTTQPPPAATPAPMPQATSASAPTQSVASEFVSPPQRVAETIRPANAGARSSAGATVSPTPAAEKEEDPRITLLLGKGKMLVGSNRAREALTCYDEILKIDVDHTEALLKKGSALERLKRDEEALWCYDRVIEADRTITLAYLYKGGVFNRQGRYDDALQCYEQALQTAEKS